MKIDQTFNEFSRKQSHCGIRKKKDPEFLTRVELKVHYSKHSYTGFQFSEISYRLIEKTSRNEALTMTYHEEKIHFTFMDIC